MSENNDENMNVCRFSHKFTKVLQRENVLRRADGCEKEMEKLIHLSTKRTQPINIIKLMAIASKNGILNAFTSKDCAP